MLKFQDETGLLLRGNGNVRIPFPMKQQNQPSSRIEEGGNASLLELWHETRCSSQMGMSISRNFLVSSTLSCFKRDGGISLETLLWKRDTSHVEGRISWFFSSCGGKLGVPLELRRGPQGPAHIASEKLGLFLGCEGHVRIPLILLPSNGPCLEFSRETQCSSPAVTGISGFLSRFN